MMTFERWNCWYDRSQIYYRFKSHHTEINRLYWALVPGASFVKYVSRKSQPGLTPEAVFHAGGPDVRRIAPNMPRWKKDFSDFENWTRLSMLVSALSYFEIYLSTIVTMAMRSDPLLRYGQARAIDGTVWLKRQVSDDVSEFATSCVKGKWSERISAYTNLFGRCPEVLISLESQLEKARVLRNGVAHSFGRSPTYFEDPAAPLGAAERLSESRLLAYLASIEQVAVSIDEHILTQHIGSFELIWHYHRWQSLPRHQKEPRYPEWIGFSRNVSRVYGTGPNRNYFRQLLNYYDNQ